LPVWEQRALGGAAESVEEGDDAANGKAFCDLCRMKKKRRTYEPRVFDGRIIMSDEIERIHKEVLEFDRIEAISDPMRELIEDLCPSWRTSCRRKSRRDNQHVRFRGEADMRCGLALMARGAIDPDRT
jgi:hypothetical protein